LADERERSASAAGYWGNERYFVARRKSLLRRRVLLVDRNHGHRWQSLGTRKVANAIEQITHGSSRRQVYRDAIPAEHVGVRREEQDSYGHPA
jgi:hypothetical protein